MRKAARLGTVLRPHNAYPSSCCSSSIDCGFHHSVTRTSASQAHSSTTTSSPPPHTNATSSLPKAPSVLSGGTPRFVPRPDASFAGGATMLLCGMSFATAAYAGAQAYGWLHASSDEWHWGPAGPSRNPFLGLGDTNLVRTLKMHLPPHPASLADSHPPTPPTPLFGPYAIADAAAKAAPAVVNIVVDAPGGALGGGPFPGQLPSSGSGFIFDSNGTILTNAHVVADPNGSRGQPMTHIGAPSRRPLLVTLQDGRQFEGTVVSIDRVTDLAVVKIDAEDKLPAVQLGSSAGLRAGEWVVALGSPLHLQNTVTHGIVSCVDRKAVELGLADVKTDFIQTDAAINRGNSGGPLINLRGEVIGISNMKAIAADGVSFAIPVDTAKEVVAQLLTLGRVIRPYLGIKMLQLNTANVAQLQRRDPTFPDVQHGILVPYVTPGSPADKAGLRAGDVVIGFDGCDEQGEVTTTAMVRELHKRVGQAFTVRVQRGKKTHALQIHVEEANGS